MRSPSEWADAQRAFREAYEADPSAYPATPVRFAWRQRRFESAMNLIARPLIERLLTLLTGRPSPDSVIEVVVYPAGDSPPPVASELLAFEVRPDAFPEACTGLRPGELVGELEPNGTLGLRTLGGMVWPVYNPRSIVRRR